MVEKELLDWNLIMVGLLFLILAIRAAAIFVQEVRYGLVPRSIKGFWNAFNEGLRLMVAYKWQHKIIIIKTADGSPGNGMSGLLHCRRSGKSGVIGTVPSHSSGRVPTDTNLSDLDSS